MTAWRRCVWPWHPAFLLCAALWICATPAFADQLVVSGVNHADAKVLGLDHGRLQFRDAGGQVQSVWLADIGLMVVDRGGMFADFNQAERFLASNEPERAVVRYKRTMALARDYWSELIAARLLVAYDRSDRLDKAVVSFIRVLRGKRTGPSVAARLLPEAIPTQRAAKTVRAIESLDGAIARPIDAPSRALLELLRYDILQRLDDRRASEMAGDVAAMLIPESARSKAAYGIQLGALRWLSQRDHRATETLAGLDRAIRDCPDASLPDFLLLKGDVLLSTASTREETMEAAWPFLRVAIHFPDDERAADGLIGAARAVEKMGRSDQAVTLLKECMAHKKASDETRAAADAALRRLRTARTPMP